MSYTTDCEDGSDNVIRGIARRTATIPRSSLTHRKKRVKPRYSDEEQGRAAPSRQERTELYVTVCEDGSDKVIRGIARFYSRAVPTANGSSPFSSTSIG